MANLLAINGSAMPTPTTYQVGVMDITNAERNANGLMIIERIATKKKISITYAFLDASSLSTVLNFFSSIYFNVTYLDPITNSYVTGSFYVGDRTLGMIDFKNSVPRYKDVSLDLIER